MEFETSGVGFRYVFFFLFVFFCFGAGKVFGVEDGNVDVLMNGSMGIVIWDILIAIPFSYLVVWAVGLAVGWFGFEVKGLGAGVGVEMGLRCKSFVSFSH